MSDDAPVTTFKKRSRNTNLRVKEEEAAPRAIVVSEPDASEAQGEGARIDGDDADAGLTDDGDVKIVRKERKLNASPFVQATGSSKAVDGTPMLQQAFQSKRMAGSSIQADENATATLEVDTERDRDAEAQHQRQLAITKELSSKGLVDDGVYRGMSGYTTFAKKEDAEHGAKYRPGPQRASSNIRTTIRFDYQPDICKDYKETGFCGFGDSCKFLHDRSDYKSGWQLDREWDQKTYGKQDPNAFEIKDEDKDDDGLPFACFICRSDFINPVVTKCSHYFCEKCAMDQFKKSPKCAACGAPTLGIFNSAKNLVRKLDEKKKRLSSDPPA